MLAADLRPKNCGAVDQEAWDAYSRRLSLPDNGALKQFYRQVPYDHFGAFNARYPNFNLDAYDIGIEALSALETEEKIRYFSNEVVDFWVDHFDEMESKANSGAYRYEIYVQMVERRTFPFPPILLDASGLSSVSAWPYGAPLHLIEGTHRVSYLRRMRERGLISSSSQHDFVILRPKSSHA